jgi:rhamnulokinase
MGTVVAVDLGATSGRVVVGAIEGGRVRTEIVARFPNRPVATPDGLHWDIHGLFASVIDGLAAARRASSDVASVAIDSWAIDYGLMRGGRLVGNPFHYRDQRVNGVIDEVHAIVAPKELFRRNGLQHLPFTTLYQLCADRQWLDIVDTALLIPDLIGYWLTGVEHAERTNASTTGLLNVASHTWDLELCEQLGIPGRILPSLVEPGVTIGSTLPYLTDLLGGGIPIVSVGSHDTASAVVAVPMDPTTSVYISCGTWALVGVETESPIVSEQARMANFTNEAGVDGRNRFLHNVMGLWLINESLRTWGLGDDTDEIARLVKAAAHVDHAVAVFDPNDPRLLPPGDIPSRVEAICREQGLRLPSSRPEMLRSILESLTRSFADAIGSATTLSGKSVRTVHIVGGGSLNELLCQLTANHSGLTVAAGPVEATAIGNVLVQARACGMLSGDIEALRAVVKDSVSVTTFQPKDGGAR